MELEECEGGIDSGVVGDDDDEDGEAEYASRWY